MNTRITGRSDRLLTRDWVAQLVAAGRRNGLNGDLVPVRGWLGGAMLVACVRKLGGTVRPDQPFHGWIIADNGADLPADLFVAAPELVHGEFRIADFHGVVAIELEGERFLALRTDEPVHHTTVERALVLVGPSLEATMRLGARLGAARKEILAADRLNVFGTKRSLYADSEFAEDDLILPQPFKSELMGFVDGFARAAEICRRLRITPSRGVLFAGAPGTGKTQTVRHVLTRLRSFQHFVFTVTSNHGEACTTIFELMLDKIRDLGEPAVVVIEDIDRLFETRALTPQFFLNVLDGLFQPAQPVLWIATSNDPRGLEANLLDRPGRFDRVFAFPMPGVEERRAFVHRYSAWPVDADVVGLVARDSDGLTGAHLREICYAAALRTAEEPSRFAAALLEELEAVKTQHRRARSYDFELGDQKAGFGR